MAQRLQRVKIANFSFAPLINGVEVPVTLAQVQHSGMLPPRGEALYELILSDLTAT